MANWATRFESFLLEGDGLRTTVSLLAISIGLIFTYYSYRVSVWYSRIRAIGQQVDKLPGPKKDFIFGNFLQVTGYFKWHHSTQFCKYGFFLFSSSHRRSQLRVPYDNSRDTVYHKRPNYESEPDTSDGSIWLSLGNEVRREFFFA